MKSLWPSLRGETPWRMVRGTIEISSVASSDLSIRPFFPMGFRGHLYPSRNFTNCIEDHESSSSETLSYD